MVAAVVSVKMLVREKRTLCTNSVPNPLGRKWKIAFQDDDFLDLCYKRAYPRMMAAQMRSHALTS
jgi:hypothetical protein